MRLISLVISINALSFAAWTIYFLSGAEILIPPSHEAFLIFKNIWRMRNHQGKTNLNRVSCIRHLENEQYSANTCTTKVSSIEKR